LYKKAIIIGGTGATGRQLIKQLLANNNWGQITSIGRRPVLNGEVHEKLQDIVIDSLFDLSSTIELWKNNDIFFNCIGTTKKRAGNAQKFINIELDISMEAAKIASNTKIPHASIISASGANHNIWASNWIHPLLYIKTMGQKEQTLINNKFSKISIFRPGMLIRLMDNLNWFEKKIQKNGFGLRVDDLALAMMKDAINKNEKKSSIQFYYNDDIKKIIKY
tara:strand:- start:103 stop:765 length:663 start_codon:yes stop_codon:yes gene_type:complete